MNPLNFSLHDPQLIRATAADPNFISTEIATADKTSAHKFQKGDEARLVGLVDFKEYNGDHVTISSVREDGPNGRAYYISGRIVDDGLLNWVYEYRLEAAAH